VKRVITIIVAADEDLLIGQKGSANGMPWTNKEDLKHFKETTLHHDVLFGMKTFLAMGGRPLPKRHTIVVTRSDYTNDKVTVAHDLKAVIKKYRDNHKDLFICGGAGIYAQALDEADVLLLSRIPGHHSGETYFPSFENHGYKLVESKAFETFTLEKYVRDNHA
jgi:dihydrofolate reductase